MVSKIRALRLVVTLLMAAFSGAVLALETPVGTTFAKAADLEPNRSTAPCNHCEGWALPGERVPHSESKWGIISDLPESFRGYGVLYSTRDVLPANGGAPELLRQTKVKDWVGIDDSFDVFLFHLLKEKGASARIVVCAKNIGLTSVTLDCMQVIKSEGEIGRVHEFESTLGRRVLERDWDRPVGKVSIPPGEARAVAYGKQFGNIKDGPDASHNVNCFGYVRAKVQADSKALLEVSVIAIPAGEAGGIEAEAAQWAEKGAQSTDEVPLDRAPEGCALKRAVGVYRNFVWSTRDVMFDVANLDAAGTSFPMALPAIQTQDCEAARQTQDLVLHPGYTRGDTIGNYMIEYDLRFKFTNSSATTRTADITFGKSGADIGLAYQAAEGAAGTNGDFAVLPVKTAWAGPRQSAMEKSLLERPLNVAPGAARDLSLHFLICGNSSLPFTLTVKRY